MIRKIGLIALLSLVSCQNTETYEVRFASPETPDPFAGVDELQVWGVVGEGLQDLGRHRWDQGLFTLPLAPVEVGRLVFAGLATGTNGRVEAVLSAGRTRALDVPRAPPTSALVVDFWATGRLSRLEALPWSGPSWLAALDDAVLVAERSEDCTEVPTLVWDGGLSPGPVLPAAFGAGPQSARIGDRTVLVGDLFTKGPDPVGVYALCRGMTAVRGNHDQRLIDHWKGKRPRDRHARDITAALDAHDPGWRDWLRSLPVFVDVAGFTVVHGGLHPSGQLDRTPKRMAQNIRRFPMDDPRAPFWWQQYTGTRRVIFGHDARRGLIRVERDGRPWLIGLDTGCVYGGQLSGYLIEDDDLVQVPAARVYKRV